MKLQEGPLFGALILGLGIGYLIYMRYQNIMMAIGIGFAILVASYGLDVLVKKFAGKDN